MYVVSLVSARHPPHPHMHTTLTSSLVGLQSIDGGSLSLLLLAGVTLEGTRSGAWTCYIANEYLLPTVLCSIPVPVSQGRACLE